MWEAHKPEMLIMEIHRSLQVHVIFAIYMHYYSNYYVCKSYNYTKTYNLKILKSKQDKEEK